MADKSSNYNQRERASKLLPGYNCGVCGFARCEEFGRALLENKANLEECRFMLQEIFNENKADLEALLKEENIIPKEKKIVGLLDKYEADFILNSLPEEHSCRETLFPFTREELKEGDIIRYRPLGCPIIHFAEILEENHGLIVVHIIGPCHRLDEEAEFNFKDIGVCMVGGFEGMIEGTLPAVGETVRFLPGHCMMQKVHSGVVVQLIDKRAIIEGIDLKVWAPPIKGER
jgi:hypothetical protein